MIATQAFGKTGHCSTRVIFGAAALSRVTQAEADRTLEVLLEYGINHIDTAASYGEAELRIGPWMPRYREQFFLATKTEQRTRAAALTQLEDSLRRMQVEYVDLWQMHNLSTEAEWETAMGPGGVLEAFIEARERGLARYLGVTGHGVQIAHLHKRSLERFAFDAVLLPWNYPMKQNVQYAADFMALTALCCEREVAVQTIKSLCRRPWGERQATRATWYEPLEDPAAIEMAVHWVLGQPGVFLNTVGDTNVLPAVLAAAVRFNAPPTDAEMADLVIEQGMLPLFA